MLLLVKQAVSAHPALRVLCAPAFDVVHRLRVRQERRLSKVYDQFFSHITGTVVLRIPEFFGSFEIDCRSHLVKRVLTTGAYEPEVAHLIMTYIDPNRDAIDVGANVGLFTVFMASLLSAHNRVLAIEAAPSAATLLRRNVLRNNLGDKAIVCDGAATAEPGTYILNVVPGLEEYSSLGEIVHSAVANRVYEQLPIQGEPVDTLVHRYDLRPGFIKLDVEGAEFHALSGAVRTIQEHRPVIVSEIFDPMLVKHGASTRMVIEFLRSHGYTVTTHSFPELLAVPNEVHTRTSDRNWSAHVPGTRQ